jgi:hypothetical protein
LCSIRNVSSPGPTNAGSVVVNDVDVCGALAASNRLLRGADAATALAAAAGHVTALLNRPSMLAPWL